MKRVVQQIEGWPLWVRVVLSFVFRFVCYAAMLWLALWNEARPSASLPDALLPAIPYWAWADRYNYWIWLAAYVPFALWLLIRDPHRFSRYMVSSGLLALLRGACIAATGLGPVHGVDVNAGMDPAQRMKAFWELASPLGFFVQGKPSVYLTKDLFFSGHTSTTGLLLLYLWKFPPARWVMLAAHGVVVATVFLAHLHYTIDVLGAYAFTLALFAVREGKPTGSVPLQRP